MEVISSSTSNLSAWCIFPTAFLFFSGGLSVLCGLYPSTYLYFPLTRLQSLVMITIFKFIFHFLSVVLHFSFVFPPSLFSLVSSDFSLHVFSFPFVVFLTFVCFLFLFLFSVFSIFHFCVLVFAISDFLFCYPVSLFLFLHFPSLFFLISFFPS